MKNKATSLGWFPYIGFLLLLLLLVWTTPAFSMAKCNGGDVSSSHPEISEPADSVDLPPDQHLRSLESIASLFISDPIGECPSSFEKQVVFFINHERNLIGLPPLQLDVRLQTAGSWMSVDMASRSVVPADHVDSLGRTFDVRVSDEGSYPYIHLGEVIAGGFSSPETVVNAWMNSPGHKARLLDPDYEHIGVGYTYDPSTDHWFYWTADLGSTTEVRLTPGLNCDPRFYLLFLSLIQQ